MDDCQDLQAKQRNRADEQLCVCVSVTVVNLRDLQGLRTADGQLYSPDWPQCEGIVKQKISLRLFLYTHFL